jgi:hypothetical protein
MTGGGMSMNKTPIHPLRLCEEVKNIMKRDAISWSTARRSSTSAGSRCRRSRRAIG